MTLKNFRVINFVAEGYRRKLNHDENFPIYSRWCCIELVTYCALHDNVTVMKLNDSIIFPCWARTPSDNIDVSLSNINK